MASFIAAIMQKLKAGRLYNLLVTARRNAECGQWLSCLCPPPHGGGDILHVPRFDIMLNDAYSFTRTQQKKTQCFGFFLSSRKIRKCYYLAY